MAKLHLGPDEATDLPCWSTKHWLLLNDRETALIADGVLPASLQRRCAAHLAYRTDQEQEDECRDENSRANGRTGAVRTTIAAVGATSVGPPTPRRGARFAPDTSDVGGKRPRRRSGGPGRSSSPKSSSAAKPR